MSSYQAIRPRSSNPPTEDDASQRSSQPAESAVSVGKGRKRKAPAHVSQNACTNCKKARAKCDGIEWQTCSRCNSRALSDSCQYEVHVKTAKEELVRRIKHLEGTIDQMQAELKEKDTWIQTLRDIFSPGTRGFTILEQLQNDGDSYQALIDTLSSLPKASRHIPGNLQLLQGSDSGDAMDTDDDNTSRWTSVTQDESKIHHLMALYFAWVHPVHMFFSERHFLDSFKNRNGVYCSSALVNAICAMGCRYCEDVTGSKVAITRLGDRFTQQVWAELKLEKVLTPLSAVTYAIMFLVELSAGDARAASSHLRLATDSLREVNKFGWSEEAFQITFFGINALNINWCALVYQKPPAPVLQHAKVFENVELDRPGQSWRHYKVEGDAIKPDIASRALATAKESAKLSIINLDAISTWCGGRGRVTTKHILGLYGRYLSWKQELPPALCEKTYDLQDFSVEGILPYTLLLHITYCVAICQLFNPLLECRQLPKIAKLQIQAIIVRSAQEGLGICEKFAKCFNNRYQSPLQAYCMVHLADVILRLDKQSAERIIYFCLKQLGEALPGFPVVGPLQSMFCESVLACGLDLPKDVDLLMGGRSWKSYSREDKLGCSERLTYTQPVDLLAAAIDPSLPETFKSEWDDFMKDHGRWELGDPERRRPSSTSTSTGPETRSSEMRAMDISSLMNPRI
ncbi:uncharacterized protein PV09_03094 [Verruconis gallopava]|uniref:Zn(2)-C6 fungal-type domain-containing protein n=1 Tax=Verruconis gallopava TaxID=253628 RepID=A0A0D2AH61_9PEZI|nr:uncharacterized protein PV09_03094 [Verruconis gallopava]KIW05900.1 hypothetical protein PV09_03094 [Verruconis gallopava]